MKFTKIIIFIAFFLNYLSYAQSKSCNLILIIDNKIVTQNLEMIFHSENLTDYKFQYSLGKELNLNNDLLKNENVTLNFNYDGLYKDFVKTYKYNIDLKSGWINNTSYLIIRIYNLDKKQFKKAFCKELKDYAVEVQNQSYIESNIVCKKIDRF
ncbi:hypothetical protein QQY79_08265 [Flavobacterium tructae]|uniref:hypothetical protein n=1 Tax=Flavobacterium tructae TaxID=1114873 RepID=UPI002551DAC4|nr:hypothetical protein [Flavobacterium tructae]MDL2142512.1 hypothetical protein [Flavobacterium tructae]